MTTTAEALEVMAMVAACHHRTAPRMDDPEAAVVTATVWAELFSVYKLELRDLIGGVKKRALSHSDAPEPADVIHFAREFRKTRLDNEIAEAIWHPELVARNQAKLAAIVTPIVKAKGVGPDHGQEQAHA